MDSTPHVKTSPKDFFLYIAVFAALYVSAISILRLWFEVINTAVPDPLAQSPYYYYGGFASSSLRLAVASLVVVFPLYLVFSRFLEKEVHREPSKRGLWVRKWLTYLTLFVAGVTLTVDLIVLVNTFLGGEITLRFVLKVFAILVVAAAVFGRYFFDVRKEAVGEEKRMRLFAWGTSGVVVLSIVGSFFIIGSPMNARLARFDAQRLSDLQTLQWQVITYWQQKEALPTALENLESPLTGFVAPRDPQTAAAYEYRALSDLSFELCATFSLEGASSSVSGKYPGVSMPYPGYPGMEADANWEHGTGRACFERTIDPDLYPSQKRPALIN